VEEIIMIDEMADRRSFTGPDGETEYYIGNPNAEDIRGADWQYSKTYTKCLNEGIPTSAELMDILKKRGVIGEHFDKRVSELQDKLNTAIVALNSATTNEEKASAAVDVARVRDSLFQWNQRLSGPMSNTCEQMADDARLEYLTSRMIQYEDGTNVWETYEKFLNEKSQQLVLKSRYEVMLYLQGYDSDFLEKTPEAVAMKEIETELLSRVNKEMEDDNEKEEVAEKSIEEPKDKKKNKKNKK
jgi:hypothetical protein